MQFVRLTAVSTALILLAGCVTPMPGRSPNDVPVAQPGELAAPVTRRAPKVDDCDSVVAINARNTQEGIAKEDDWIARNHPGATAIARRLTECNGRKAEVITLRDRNGFDINVTFDISSFFGKTSTGDDLDSLLDG